VQSILFEIFIFLAVACIVVPIFSYFKLGAVLGYLVAGLIIGPCILGVIANSKEVMHFAEFGVVMMMFVIGLELEPSSLWRLKKVIIGFGSAQMLITTAILCILGCLLGFSWKISLASGMALALSSTALVLQMLNEKKLLNTPIGETSFSILLFQDLAVIPILIVLPLLTLASHQPKIDSANSVQNLPGYMQTLVAILVITAVILSGHYLSHYLFRMIAKTKLREIFTALSLALILGITLLMLMVGISPALGAFIAGLVLANSAYRKTLETDIEPFKGLLLGLFFMSVGMGIDLTLLYSKWFSILLAVIGLMMIKALIIWALGRRFGMLSVHALGCALALSQGGEFAFVLFQLADNLAILSEYNVHFLTLVVALSIATTPFLMFWYQRYIIPRFMSVLPQQSADNMNTTHPIIIAGFGRFGQIIGRFMSAQGISLTVLENNPDQIDLIRKFGFKAYYGDATRLDILRLAGAEKAKLLIIAVDGVEASLEIASIMRHEFPDVTLFARARNRDHAYNLHKIGVYYFKRELFDSSLEMAQKVMIWLGHDADAIKIKAKQFAEHDENHLLNSFQFFEDESRLINFAKTGTEELKHILQIDKQNE
jgi:glutathione-regulated potassium-efflux system ancillary protein KefC